jgi:hypothetical protein
LDKERVDIALVECVNSVVSPKTLRCSTHSVCEVNKFTKLLLLADWRKRNLTKKIQQTQLENMRIGANLVTQVPEEDL